jgi:hypothetical protein
VHINRKLLSFSRSVHIYLTMLGLFVMMLFGVTGFTVNHEDWFGATTPHVTESEGHTPVELVAKKDALRIVEHLRKAHGITGALTGFEELEGKFSMGFKEPGRLWEVEVEKPSGKTHVHAEAFNFIALVNNLHRGRYAGPGWRWVIDLCALFIALACATGLVLWLALPKRRQLGILAVVLGTLGTIAIYLALVPGPDTETQIVEPPTANSAPTTQP